MVSIAVDYGVDIDDKRQLDVHDPIIISSNSEVDEENETKDFGQQDEDRVQVGTCNTPEVFPQMGNASRRKWTSPTRSVWSAESSSSGSSDESGDDEQDARFCQSTEAAASDHFAGLAECLLHSTAGVDEALANASEEERRRMQSFLAETMATTRTKAYPGNGTRRTESDLTRIRHHTHMSGPRHRPSGKAEAAPARRITHVVSRSSGTSNCVRAEAGDGHTVILPRPPRAKGRRFLIPSDAGLPMAALYMRGDVQFIVQGTRCVTVSLWEGLLNGNSTDNR